MIRARVLFSLESHHGGGADESSDGVDILIETIAANCDGLVHKLG